MTILATQDPLRDLKSKDAIIPEALRAYFQQRLYNRIHQTLLGLLDEEERSHEEFSKRKLACRIEKKPEQITRWLSYPGNMTLETLSDLFLGFGCEMEVRAKDVLEKRKELLQANIFLTNTTIIKKSAEKTFRNYKEFKDVPRSGSASNSYAVIHGYIQNKEIQSNG